MGKYEYGNSKCKFKWNNEGFIEVLNTEELAKLCEDVAKEIQQKAGPDHFEADRWYSHKIGKLKGGRVAAIVYAKDDKGLELEATEKRLSRAVSACRH